MDPMAMFNARERDARIRLRQQRGEAGEGLAERPRFPMEFLYTQGGHTQIGHHWF